MLRDVAIIGGGITGLWLLNLLRDRGYEAVLVEKDGFGSGQTLASQGIIHGGVKYTLSTVTTPASETIAAMPKRWRDCLAGQGDIDLQGVRVLSDNFYLFTDHRRSSKITAFFGSKALRGKVEAVSGTAIPLAFSAPEFAGGLYQLEDLVLDTTSLLSHLVAQYWDSIYDREVELGIKNGKLVGLHFVDGGSLHAATYILAAGKDNGELARQLDIPVVMQLRPLHQVIVKGRDLPHIFAHAVTMDSGSKPGLTITTHQVGDGRNAWYLGGDLAERGVTRSPEAQVRAAKQMLATLLPWIPLDDCEFSTWRIDRAEAAQAAGQRPDSPFARKVGNVILCWPTKMTLVPLLGDMVLQHFGEPLDYDPPEASCLIEITQPEFGTPPWAR